MKWFSGNHLYVLLVVALCGVALVMPYQVFAYYYDGYNNGGYYYPPPNYGYGYNQQYQISPYMTSTVPYPVGQPSYPYYSGGYYSNGNNYPYGYYSSYSGSYYDSSYYNNGGYNNYNYSNPLTVSCSLNKPYAAQNEPVTWSAYAYGGTRGYTYIWNGTDNPMSLDASSINVTYGNTGTKSMSVIVHSADGQTATAYCGQVNIGTYPQYPYYYNGQYTYPQY